MRRTPKKGANFFISLGFTATPPPYSAGGRHLTLGPGLRARKKAASCGSGLLGQTLLLEGGSSSTTLPADAPRLFGAREVYLCVDLHPRGVALQPPHSRQLPDTG